MLPFLGVNSVSESLTQKKTGLPSLRAHRERGEEGGRRELRGSSNLQLKAVLPTQCDPHSRNRAGVTANHAHRLSFSGGLNGDC